MGRRGKSPSRRFAVYRNNVYASLIDVLGSRFPVSARLVGEEFFRAMARIYVAQTPPASPVLLHYGAEFADFVGTFPPASAVPYLACV
ncbi:DNA-binding domain-containing protein, partial [Methyloceanibacter marginalis]|uniref:HvfC/BufC N-terminal domain-containing protein n=1 Tax=Methyloceanibacter marginalis TaxID=1774971 RepID=UPI00114CA9D6